MGENINSEALDRLFEIDGELYGVPSLVRMARIRAAVLHASAAWGSSEDGALINALADEVERLRGCESQVTAACELVQEYHAGLLKQFERANNDEEAASWQPIETVPKDGTWVQCWGPDGCGIAKFSPNPIWAEYPEYTHWMPLPSPPSPA